MVPTLAAVELDTDSAIMDKTVMVGNYALVSIMIAKVICEVWQSLKVKICKF